MSPAVLKKSVKSESCADGEMFETFFHYEREREEHGETPRAAVGKTKSLVVVVEKDFCKKGDVLLLLLLFGKRTWTDDM